MPLRSGRAVRAVTFDCWGTLLLNEPGGSSHSLRRAALVRAAREGGRPLDEEKAPEVLHAAWLRHAEKWQNGESSGSPEIAQWALESLGIRDPALTERLATEFSEASLADSIPTLDGARDTLARLADRGLRRALICDTGFTPGRVVRELLDRVELLELLEVAVFSDEAGLPKPAARIFHRALEEIGSAPGESVHVGDLRRTDVAGARAVGMRSVRIRHVSDDTSELPEADVVADSHAHLCELLGLS